MVSRLLCVLRKDFSEYIRKKYNKLFAMVAIFICGGVFASALLLPNALDIISARRPELISDIGAMTDLLSKLFPADAKGNVGTVVSDFCLFYSIVVVLSMYRIIPNEVDENKWLTPLLCGYNKQDLFLSKCFVYGAGVGMPVVLLTLVYYELAIFVFEVNLSFGDAAVYAIVVGIIEVCICILTISYSVICKHSIVAAISIMGIFLAVPDIFNYFSFGKMLPTYLFTYVYSYSTNHVDVIIPAIVMVVFTAVSIYLAVRKLKKTSL